MKKKEHMNLASLVRSPTSFSSLFLSVLVRCGGLFIVGTFNVGVDTVAFVFDCILSYCLLLVEGVGFKSSTSLFEFLSIFKNRRGAQTGFFFPYEIFPRSIACALHHTCEKGTYTAHLICVTCANSGDKQAKFQKMQKEKENLDNIGPYCTFQ